MSRGGGKRSVPVAAGICLFLSAGLCAGEEADVGELRRELRSGIAGGAEAGREARISVRLLGMRVRALVSGADKQALMVEAAGATHRVPWDQVGDSLLYSAARQLVDDLSGQDHFLLARFARAKGWKDKAIGELYLAQEADPSLIDTAREIIAELEGRRRVKRVVHIKAPSIKPKPAAKGGKVQYSSGPAEMEPIRVGGETAGIPDWAGAELEFFEAVEEALGAFIDKFVTPSGAACVPVRSVSTADDIVEGIATWDRYLVMAGSERVREAYLSIWMNVYKALNGAGGGFSNGYYSGGYDAEHAGELLQHLWGCMDVFPENRELIQQNRKAAEALHRGIEPRTGLFRALFLNTAGTGRGGGKCSGHDFVYLNAFFQDYIRSGNQQYRFDILRFGEAMNRVTERTGGIIPCTVNTDGSLPADWWMGPFSYAEWGIPGVGQRGWHAYMSMAAFLTGGDCRTLRGMRRTLKVMLEKGNGRMPEKFDGTNWTQGNNWQIRHIAERLYDLCWDEEAKGIMMKSGSAVGRYLYFGGGGAGQPAATFRSRIARWKQYAEKFRNTSRMPRTGDELTELGPRLYNGFPYVDGNWWSQGYDNGRCGGVVNSPVRYFHESGRTGLPSGVAAVVTHVEEEWFRLHLYNSNAEAVRMWISGGFFGTHRIEAIKVGGEVKEVGSPRALLEIRGKSEAELDVVIIRYAYRPHAYPWKYRGVPAERLPEGELRVLLRIPF